MGKRPETYEDWVSKKEEAFRTGDAIAYFEACAETDYNPQTDFEQDLILMALGEQDYGRISFGVDSAQENNGLRRNRNRSVSNATYDAFLEDAQGIGGVQDASKIRGLLIRYFPRRFGEEGRQALQLQDEQGRFIYGSNQVNRIFGKVVTYAKRRLKR